VGCGLWVGVLVTACEMVGHLGVVVAWGARARVARRGVC